MRAEIKALLEADTELMAILVGGIYDTGEISRQNTPTAFDDVGQVKPCALLSMSTRSPSVSGIPRTADQYIMIYFYQQSGYDQIDAAVDRVYMLLNKAQVNLSTGFNYEITHADDLGDSEDSALGCSMRYSRYKAVNKR